MDSTSGLYQYINDPALADCVIVQVLKRCGAIPFAKTNLAQMTKRFGIFCVLITKHDLQITNMHAKNKINKPDINGGM